MERRLAAIMATDVVGYSRLIRADEEGTLAALKALRADLIDPKIAEHRGRIVKLMGDGMLVEFASVVDAVHAAVQTQQAMTDHNADVSADKRMELRIGINLGDVVIDGDDIQGDGINVAARLEGLAETGGICISGKVYEEVRDRMDVPFEDLGEQAVKNIDRPVRVWRWIPGGDKATFRDPVAKQALSSSHMPKVAVLPFDNLGRTDEAEAFCDGLCEDITTELSRQASFDVVARNTMLAYKGSTVNIKDAGLELGARYVLEGSVRFAGPRVRVTAQLIKSETESHIWAERYDRTEEDVFTLQDELSRAIAIATTMQIAKAERERGSCAADAGRLASSLLKKGQRIWYRFDKASNLEARQTYEQALALEPDNYLVHISLAWTYCNEYRDIHGNNPEDAPAKAIEHAEKAVRLSDGSYNSYHALAVATACTGDMERAKLHISRALELNPNDTDSMMNHAEIFSGLGRHDKAVEMAEKSIALNEKYPSWYLATYANVLFEAGRFEDSLKARFRFVAPKNAIVEAHMAICLYALGRTEEATQHVERAMLIQPDARASSLANRYYYPIENRREEVRCMFVELGFPD